MVNSQPTEEEHVKQSTVSSLARNTVLWRIVAIIAIVAVLAFMIAQAAQAAPS